MKKNYHLILLSFILLGALNLTAQQEIEVRASEATYLQGNSNPSPLGSILRVEQNNRVSYLKFDLSSVSAEITNINLEMQVSGDAGHGTLEVVRGEHSNWFESNLNANNRPAPVGSSTSINGTHSIGQTKVWNLNPLAISTGGMLTLIVRHSNGNDVAFASDETSNGPRLRITVGGTNPGNENQARLLEATYLQDNSNPSPRGPILRVEQNNRVTYLKYDLSSFSGNISEARLEMQVAGDAGHGTIQVFRGSHSNWSETNLNASNRPNPTGSALASINGTHRIGQTKVWNLNTAALSTGGQLTLIVTHSNGNDLAFASDESANAPKLYITTSGGGTTQRPFITTWDTRLSGTSGDKSLTLQTDPQYEYNFTINWGDGTYNHGVTSDITHTYATPGIYQVSITGKYPKHYFFHPKHIFNYTEGQKLISIDQWGEIQWLSFEYSYVKCNNMRLVATDLPDLTQVSSMKGAFKEIPSFNSSNIINWDVSNVTDMSLMFDGCLNFNQDIGNWDVSSVTNMSQLFENCHNFNQDIGNWDVSSVTNMSHLFESCNNFNQDLGDWDVSKVKSMEMMFWECVNFNQDISGWDVSDVSNMSAMFRGASKFNQNIGNWDVSKVTDMTGMFEKASAFNQNLNKWDVSNVTRMSNMFRDAVSFNQEIKNWNVSNVTEMNGMFSGAINFNQDLGDWNVSNVEVMLYMFENARKFNADIGRWNVSNVKDMGQMFGNALVFNQDIGKWDVSSVWDMQYMFNNASKFNQDIGNWNVSSVSHASRMFKDAISFNRDISNWDVSNMRFMSGMFQNASQFNQDIGEWNVSNTTRMDEMFLGASKFNQDLSKWDVSNVEQMNSMFRLSNFNHDVSGWNTSNVQQMGSMFTGVKNFNQDLSAWDVSKVRSMSYMFVDTNLSDENYEKMLTNWSRLPSLVKFNHLGSNNNKYCMAEEARRKLIEDYNWTINDAGKLANCPDMQTFEARLIEATYLQGSSNPAPLGPILRVEENNRVSYLKFEIPSALVGRDIIVDRLEMVVAGDAGHGTLDVFHNHFVEWTELNINESSRPRFNPEFPQASISGSHNIGETKAWELNVLRLSTTNSLSIIVTHKNGNDVAFASDESANPPRLFVSLVPGSSSRTTEDQLSLSPNPAVSRVQVNFKEGKHNSEMGIINVYDLSGRLVHQETAQDQDGDGNYDIDVTTLRNGLYILKTQDNAGKEYESRLLVEH